MLETFLLTDDFCRFEILGVLGKGSFGVVAKCLDWKNNQVVALKIIRNKKRFHHQVGFRHCNMLVRVRFSIRMS